MKCPRLMRTKGLAIFLLGCLSIAQPVQAASFDCSKAVTKVDKLVCANVDLSALDGRLAEAYQAALKQAPDPAALKHRQRDWLQELHDYCQTDSCLQGAYSARIRALNDGDGAKVYDTPELKAEREVNKAAIVKNILTNHPLRLRNYVVKQRNVSFCNQYYSALRNASSTIHYIEPVLRTDDPTHPGLGEYLACNDYEPKEAYKYFMLNELGSRGFRLYRINMDGNPKDGLQEYLYGQEPVDNFNTAPAQLLKVNFKTCNVEDGIPASPEHPLDQQYNNGVSGINALTRYHRHYYFYDLSFLEKNENYYFLELAFYAQHKRSFTPICTWIAPK